jgi:hypothetical protein
MHRIADDQIRRSGTYNGLKLAASISEFCPHCGERGIFSIENYLTDAQRKTISGTARCPACNEALYFWSINSRTGVQTFMHPSPVLHQKIAQASEIPEPIVRNYNSCVDAFNSGNYVATAVLCRRTLEALFKLLLADEDKKISLAKAIIKVSEQRDLSLPLRHLSNAVRAGGNLGAHFDEQLEPTPEIARSMVELLEYIIDYIHVLPSKIEALNSKFSMSAAVTDAAILPSSSNA